MLVQKALNTISAKKMISGGDRIIIGVSGGPDSMALLHFLVNNFPKNKFHVCHLNHKLRGKESDRDEMLVRRQCSKLGLKASFLSKDAALYAKRSKLSLEEAGRRLRYEFFNRTANRIRAKKIALAHTADDNAETFLMRLVRGAGLKGFCAIPAKNGKVIRPLIDVWKSEVIEYCQENGLDFCVDSTNMESKQFRNKIRNELIPILWKYNPNIKEVLINTVNMLSEGFDYIETAAQKTLTHRFAGPPLPARPGRALGEGQGVRVSLSKLAKLHPALKTQTVRSCIEKVKGDLKDISYKHVRDILGLKKGQLHLPGGVFAVADNGTLKITIKKPKAQAADRFFERLKIPGSSRTGVKASFAARVPSFAKIGKKEAFLDASKISGDKLIVRSFKEGDSFIPLGMKGHKKLHDLFIDEKVPVHMRALVPIVCDEEKILWVAGLRLDERAKTGRNTKKILRLSID